jgi:hypothetical protein
VKYGLQLTDGDLVWSNGALVQITDHLDSIRQLIECRLSMALGTWFLDPDDGLDIYGKILGKPRSESDVRQALGARITETPGVKTLKSMSVSLDNSTRALTVAFVAQADTPTSEEISGVVTLG